MMNDRSTNGRDKSDADAVQDQRLEGGCLCGAIRYLINPPFKLFQYCHCSRCRKVSGTVYAANIFLPSQQFQWLSGGDKLGWYKIPDAKHFATAFCKHCGSSMPTLTVDNETAIVPAGGLDNLPDGHPTQSIFWASRAHWYHPPDQLPQFDQLPPKKR